MKKSVLLYFGAESVSIDIGQETIYERRFKVDLEYK